MAIKYDTALKWGDKFYLKSDPDQVEHYLTGILLLPGKPKLALSYMGDVVTVYECETTREPDIKKILDINGEPDPDEED